MKDNAHFEEQISNVHFDSCNDMFYNELWICLRCYYDGLYDGWIEFEVPLS